MVVRSHEGSNDARGGWRGSVAGDGGILPASSDMEKAEGPRRPHAAREDGSSRRRSRVTGQEGGVLRREGLEMVSERSGDLGRRLTCKNASCAYQELRWRERAVETLGVEHRRGEARRAARRPARALLRTHAVRVGICIPPHVIAALSEGGLS